MTQSALQELEQEYNSGKLDHLRTLIDGWIKYHSGEIHDFYNALRARSEKVTLVGALKMFILVQKTINPCDEISSQLREIENTIWYKGEQLHREIGPEERRLTAREWAARNAPNWRSHRMEEYVYVIERNSQAYETALREMV